MDERRRVALVEGEKDRFVDFGREVLTDGELELIGEKDKPAKRYERSNGRKNGR